METCSVEDALELARNAVRSAGASHEVASSLGKAVVAAELSGHRSVGFAHLFDYLDGFSAGRIARDAVPVITFPTPATIRINAKDGIAQLGYDLAFDDLVQRARLYGIAMFVQSNSFTVGELSYYTRRLAEAGLISLATSNGPPMVTTPDVRQPIFGTNPISFAAPVANGLPLVIDQASSATAFVNVRDASERGDPIPQDWALDAHGSATTYAADALKGLLLTFGGARGGNIALLVEVLSAGLTGANWSADVPSFEEGSRPLGVGMFITAIDPSLISPEFQFKLENQLDRLSSLGLYIPGRRQIADSIQVDTCIAYRLRQLGAKCI